MKRIIIKCVDCSRGMVKKSPTHKRCKKCNIAHTIELQKAKDILPLNGEYKYTWSKKKPETISRSTLYRRELKLKQKK